MVHTEPITNYKRYRVLTLLSLARGRIENPANWSPRHFAATKHDESCSVTAPEAAMWSVYGAIIYAMFQMAENRNESPGTASYTFLAHQAASAVAEAAGVPSCHPHVELTDWNNTHAHEEVMAAMDTAIKAWLPKDET